MAELTFAEVDALLKYDPETGKLYWKEREGITKRQKQEANRFNSRYAGKEALTANCQGYKAGTILNKRATSHRICWLLHYGVWPNNIDHINGDRSDNRIANLRSVTKKENAKNVKKRVTNKSGKPGVYWREKIQRWQANICVEGKSIYLGCFKNIEDAISAREEAEKKYCFHPNHGR